MGNENSKQALAAGQSMDDYIQSYVKEHAPELKETYREKFAAKTKQLNSENTITKASKGDEHLSKRLDRDDALFVKLSQQSELEEGQILSQEPEPVPLRSKDTNSDDLLASFGARKEKVSAKRKADEHKEPTERPAKRPSVPNAFADDRRPSMPKIQKKSTSTSARSPMSPSTDKAEYGQQLQSVPKGEPPKWYNDTPTSKSRQKNTSNTDALLQSLKEQITKCKQSGVDANRAKNIREKLHTIFFIEVNASILKANRMLHDESGLPQLFDRKFSGKAAWPYDIKADAKELYNKWCRRIFETDILRGIAFGQKDKDGKALPDSKTVDSIEDAYKPFVVSSKFHGNGDLLNGQWWPLQLCALRDGAHGATIAGISGDKGDGAYSCIMSGGHDYPDKDYGDVVLYCGTDSTDGSVTANTQLMLESVNNQPVRLIRSSNLGGDYAPEKGFRYDGLYDVVSYEMLDPSNSLRQRHRFKLVRQAGQDPIRGGKGPDKRPTTQELEQYENHRRMTGKSKGRKSG